MAARPVEGPLLLEVPGKYRSSHSTGRKLFKSCRSSMASTRKYLYRFWGRVGAPARVTRDSSWFLPLDSSRCRCLTHMRPKSWQDSLPPPPLILLRPSSYWLHTFLDHTCDPLRVIYDRIYERSFDVQDVLWGTSFMKWLLANGRRKILLRWR